MKPQIFNSRVLEIENITPRVKYLKLSVPENLKKEFDFKAGQYFSLSVPRDDGKKIRKPFSIINIPSENNKIEFIAKLIPDGLASEYIKKLGKNEEVELFGPAGKFIVEDSFEKDLVFIASGVGVAPFISIIRNLLQKGFKKNLTLIKSARNEDEILYDELFNQLSKEHTNFEFYNILSQPKNKEFANKGYIQDFLDEFVPEDFRGNFYICGLQNMVDSTREKLNFLGFEDNTVFVEEFD